MKKPHFDTPSKPLSKMTSQIITKDLVFTKLLTQFYRLNDPFSFCLYIAIYDHV